MEREYYPLYDPRFEHDACGIGAVINIQGIPSRRTVDDALTRAGLTLSGMSPGGHLVEAVELSDLPFYVGVQYHPEFKSRPNRPHPLFVGLLEAALQKEEQHGA